MSVIDPQIWKPVLDSLIERNAAVEISGFLSGLGEVIGPTHRVRLFQMHPRGLIIERPERLDVGVYFNPGTRLRIQLSAGKTRWEFSSTVRELFQHEVNASVTVRAMSINPPVEVSTAQRRSCYRVGISGIKLLPIRMQPIFETDSPLLSPEPEPENPFVLGMKHAKAADPQKAVKEKEAAEIREVWRLIAGDPVEHVEEKTENQTDEMHEAQKHESDLLGKLLNISGGGFAVQVSPQRGIQLQENDRFICTFSLPRLPKTIMVQARLVHCHIEDSGSCYLGMIFDYTDTIQRRRVGDLINRFTSWLQRQQLQQRHEQDLIA